MAEQPAPQVEHRAEIGSDTGIQAASWSCTCGTADIVRYARPGMGEVVALRLARLLAARHEAGEEAGGMRLASELRPGWALKVGDGWAGITSVTPATVDGRKVVLVWLADGSKWDFQEDAPLACRIPPGSREVADAG